MTDMSMVERKVWIVEGLCWTGKVGGEWRALKAFRSPGEADEWMCELARTKGYRIDDLRIEERRFFDARAFA